MNKYIPEAMQPFILPFNWEVSLVWAVEAPADVVPLADLEFLLTNPFWSRTPRRLDFDLRPCDVLSGQVPSAYHEERIARADTRHALDFIRDGGRLFILDGIHRVAKLTRAGETSARARFHPMSIRPRIEVQRTRESDELT